MARCIRDYKSMIRQLKQEGWQLEPTNNGHFWAVAPNRRKTVIGSERSAAEYRAVRNMVCQLNRIFPFPLERIRCREKPIDINNQRNHSEQHDRITPPP